MRVNATGRTLATLVLAAASCAPARAPADVPAPNFLELAAGFRPSFEVAADDSALEVTPAAAPGVVRLGRRATAAEWREHGGGLWSLARTAPGLQPAQGPKQGPRLVLDGVQVPALRRGAGRQLERAEARGHGVAVPEAVTERPGFHVAEQRAYLLLPADAAPPGEARLVEHVQVGREIDGRWRLALAGVSADGLPILAGGQESLQIDAPPAAALRFRAQAVGAALRLRVWAGEQRLLDQPVDRTPRPYELPLPVAGGPLELRFEVQGEGTLVALLAPVIGPSDIGEHGRRPWPGRPDVVLLLADTFRADNLVAWGGDPLVAPALNALAARSRRYLQARAPATWTLPSHAAMFAARYPHQVGVSSPDDKLASGVWTLAEQLRAAGYRTAAVTDGGFVSTTFGMDQGFETFEEQPTVDPKATVEAVDRLLEADDGRPLFLFVQSYRAHGRGVISPEIEARLAGHYTLGERVDFGDPERFARLEALLTARPRGTRLEGPDYRELVWVKEQYYAGASAEADVGFGHVLESLARAGLEREGVLAFTSDHGESFGRHGVVGHGTGVWDEQARVPLLIAAPGLAREDDPRPASLIDLPRTLCRLADVDPHPSWGGFDLTASVPGDRATAVFQCYPNRIEDVAVVRSRWKAIFEGDAGLGPLRFLYHLDGNEDEDRDRRGEEGLPVSIDDLRTFAEEAAREVIAADDATLPTSRRAQLDALGYGGDDEDE